jgi:pre-mRNA-processing factor SLU7
VDKYERLEAERRKAKQEEKEKQQQAEEAARKAKEERKLQRAAQKAALAEGGGDGTGAAEDGGDESDKDSANSDSGSDYDSDEDDDSEDDTKEFLQKDEKARDFQGRAARQGGVGGAQMKTTVRNLRIREDTPKYLRNLDLNSAHYDPKARSMRMNPLPNENPEDLVYAGDNFVR